MGLFKFNRKKKPTAEEVAHQATAARAAEEAAKKQAQAARAASIKSQQDAKRNEEQDRMERIQKKKKDIARREEAVRTFEIQKQNAQKRAIAAKNQKRMEEAKSHLRDSKNMERKINNHTVQINMLREQLQTLEDVAIQKETIEGLAEFKDYMGKHKVDADQVEEDLTDMRENMASVEQINQTFQADMNINQSIYDMDAEEELNALEAEFNKTAIDASPQVPTAVPTTPATKAPAASSSTLSPEEEEIRRLEQGLAM